MRVIRMKNKNIKKYRMDCSVGYYESSSYIELGWLIFTHRLWHLYKHKRWMD